MAVSASPSPSPVRRAPDRAEMARRGRMRAAALHAFRSPEELAEWRRRAVAAALARFEHEVDPHGRLDPEIRREKALHARRLHMWRIAAKSAEVRRRRRNRRASGGPADNLIAFEAGSPKARRSPQAVARSRST